MPAENPQNPPGEDGILHDNWEQLAHDAAQNWDLGHPGVRGLYENHVVPQLHGRGLGHLAIGTTELRDGNASDREDGTERLEPGRSRINVEQDSGDPIPVGVITGAAARQLVFERASNHGNLPHDLPESEVAPEDSAHRLESERKMNTTENLRALQKRFGERFVKGDLMEGGGYTGNAARELLAGFMDRPGFADKLKRLIPGKHGALALLKDNHDYIQATLEKWYKDDPDQERVPVRDPYELARSVGYELTGPFQSTSEFVPYDKLDFPPGRLGTERLCTFNNPSQRLKEYHILWLRREGVADIVPADQLTTDTLSEPWKTYLKTIGRYDPDTDTYDLNGLRPTRDDPYGTSSMSVQISRTGTHVSIKNRYNHLVGNPDNTLDSNLDNVAYGLKHAVYSRVGRTDLMDKTSVSLAEGYTPDNDGGIHRYEYEDNNVYYGDYEYISNGVVTTIDRGRYYMISPQLYVSRNGKGDELRLGQRSSGITGPEVSCDVRWLYKSSKGNEKDPVLAELRRAYAERDFAELKARTIEQVRAQVGSAYDGYREVADQLLGFSRREGAPLHEIEQLFMVKDKEWQTNGVYDYLVEKLILEGTEFTLTATPNVSASWQQIKAVATRFGEGQPYSTYAYDKLLEQYSAAELSGTIAPDVPARLSLIPNRSDDELGYTTADNQQATLAELSRSRPGLRLHVPSVLDAVTFWQTLRARGDSLVEGSFNKTFIRHFDLTPRRVVSWSCVPRSYVIVGGVPYVGRSYADRDLDARVAVG